MKKTLKILTLVTASLVTESLAKATLPNSVEVRDRANLSKQASSFATVITPLVKEVSSHVVSIKFRGQQLALGTVTDKGIVTKWSEVARFASKAHVVTAGGKATKLKIIGVYQDYDLVLLSNETGLKPIDLSTTATPDLGDFIVMSGVNGQPGGLGVVSVKKRSLRDTDKAFLGIQMNFQKSSAEGVWIDRVVDGTGAKAAGLRAADRLLAIDGSKLESPIETKSIIARLKPGQRVKLSINRAGTPMELDVLLGKRPAFKKIPQARLNKMERMGKRISAVRTGFPSVVQSDMQVQSHLMGAPVINLNGKIVGVSISRSRMKTYLIPADELAKLLKIAPGKAKMPLAQVQPQNEANRRNGLQLHQKQFEEMEKRMKLMREEMKRFEQEMEKMKK